MKQTFEQYSLELSGIAERLAQEAEMRARCEHLRAFNFGRSVEHLEDTRRRFWLRTRWLLLGMALGATLAAGYVQALGGGR
jgi:hypothetical protein